MQATPAAPTRLRAVHTSGSAQINQHMHLHILGFFANGAGRNCISSLDSTARAAGGASRRTCKHYRFRFFLVDGAVRFFSFLLRPVVFLLRRFRLSSGVPQTLSRTPSQKMCMSRR